MATYFFSGIDKPELIEVLAACQASGMVNALSAGQPKLREAYARWSHVELALDSGACQGNRNVERYARLVKELAPRLVFCSNLDVLHNQSQSDEHFQLLQYLLANHEPARKKLLWIYQCQSRGSSWHHQGDVVALKRAVEKHKMVGIGGLVSVLERDPIEAHDLLCLLGEILNEAEAQAHLFGPGNYPLLRWLVTQRWCRSADSARWIHGLKSRMLLTRDGQVIRGEKLLFPRLQCAENNVRAIQEWMQPQPVEALSPFPSLSHTAPSVQLQWLDDTHALSLP
jgi:hypothetical protein